MRVYITVEARPYARADKAQIHSGLRGNVEDESIVAARRTNTAGSAAW
jgi:hypothetical protein